MTSLTAPKIIAGLITAIWGFALAVSPYSGQPAQPDAIAQAPIRVQPYLIEPTTTTSSTIYIDPYTTACEQFSALAVNLGWPADQRTVLESIIKRESNCTPNAINRNDPNGGSRGLLQINGFWHKYLIERGIINKPKDLLHADTNLLAGLAIYQYGVDRYGFGWGPWSTK